MSIDRQHVSEATHFLRELEQKPEFNRSPAKQAEVAKYEKLNELRDKVQPARPDSNIWGGF